MKFIIAAICATLLCGGAAIAQEMRPASDAAPSFLIFPSWYEVMDIIKQGETKEAEPATILPPASAASAAPSRPQGMLRPYLGVADISPTAYLVPGNLLDVSGGLSYYAPRTGKTGSVGMILAVKDRVSNRLIGYSFAPENLTTYVSLSINY